MKRYIYRIMLVVSLIAAPTLWSYAAGPPDPPPPESGNPIGPGGDAPIGSGLMIMLAMGATWAGKKTYDAHKDSK